MRETGERKKRASGWSRALMICFGVLVILTGALLYFGNGPGDATPRQSGDRAAATESAAPVSADVVRADGAAADLSGHIRFADVDTLYLNGNLTESDIVTVDGGVSYTITPDLDSLQAGDQTIQVTVEDEAGNTYTLSRRYSVVEVDIAVAWNFAGMTAEDVVEEFIAANGLEGTDFACFYYNTGTGEEVIAGGDTVFRGASTVKLPLAMAYYDWIADGTLREDDTLQLTYSCVEEGGGSTTADYAIGSYVPISYLLEQAIVGSDNTAMNILVSHTGFAGYRSAIAGFAETELPEEFYTTNVITATYAYEVLRYLYDNREDYETLIEHMRAAAPGEYLQLDFEDYEVAHKYGAYEGNLHDYGIVYAPREYLIGVFTNGTADAEELIASFNQWMLGYTLYNLNK